MLEHQEPLLTTLAEPVSWPTFAKGDKNEDANRAIGELGERLARTHTVQQYDFEGYRSLFASVAEDFKPSVLLLGHIDTVNTTGDPAWQRDPLELTLERGRAYALGTCDMKAGVTIILRLAQVARPGVAYMITSDEERGTRFGVEKLCSVIVPTFCIALEPTNLKIVNENKGFLNLEVEVSGRSAHSSRPWEGINALDVFGLLKGRLLELPLLRKENPRLGASTVAQTLMACPNNAENVVPSPCRGVFNIRFIPEVDAEELEHQATVLAGTVAQDTGANIQVTRYGTAPWGAAVGTPQDNPHVKRLVASLQDKGLQAELKAEHGASDGRFFSEQGIAAVDFGPVGGNMHAPNEYVEVRSVEVCYEVLRDFLAFPRT